MRAIFHNRRRERPAANLAPARDKVSATLGGFHPGQKRGMGVAGGVVLAGVLALAVLHGKTDWTPLYTQLAPADASAITKKLDSSGVAYQLADGGGTIPVSKDVVYQTRIDMASVALPSDSTVGYGILDNQSMTSSDFMQQVSYQRAMEGDWPRPSTRSTASRRRPSTWLCPRTTRSRCRTRHLRRR